jgi:uncharacterized membrane protein
MIELEEARSVEQAQWSRLAQALARLALIGAAIGWALPLRRIVDSAFLIQNALPEASRRSLVLGVVCGAIVPSLWALGWFVWRRWGMLRALERVVIATAPLAVFAFLPTLLVPTVWYRNPLPFLALLAFAVLVLERCLVAWLREFSPTLTALVGLRQMRLPAPVRRFLPLAIVLLSSLAYTAYSLYYSLQQHYRLNTAAYDLGIYDNLMYTAMKGHPFRSTVLLGPSGGNYLAGHAEFALLLFVPFYWLWQSAQMLLTLQAIALGFAAVPLYLFARTQLTRGAAVLLSITFLLFAPLHGSSFYDFHWLPISIFFQFLLFFSIARDKKWLFICSYAMLTLLREDISVDLTVLGMFLLLSGIRPRLGLFMMACSAVCFVLIKFVIMTWAGPFFFADLYYRQLVAPGEQGFKSVIQTLMTNPAYVINTVLEPKKVNYFLHLMAPLAFIPLRRGLLVLFISGATLFTFLTTAYEPTVSLSFQYSSHWIPFLFGAVVLWLGVVSRDAEGAIRRRAALGALAFGVVTHSYVFGAVLQHETYVGGFLPVPFHMTQAEKDTYAALRRAANKIPREASVAATDLEVPHVSNRFSIYTLRSHHGDADYLLVNRASVAADTKNVLKDAISRNDYGLVANEAPFYLFKRGANTPETDAALQTLGLRPRKR